MKKLVVCSLALISGSFAYAEGEKAKKEEVKWVCEKKVDGKEVRIEAKSKEDCKKQGGRWEKDHADDHGHAEGDKH